MSVKIRLTRTGSKKQPYYRIVVADSRSPWDGKFIEQVGIYHPLEQDDKKVKFDKEKLSKWVLNGAKPTDVVRKLLNKNDFRCDRDLLTQEK